MAGLSLNLTFEGIENSVAAKKTVVQIIAAANHRAVLKRLIIGGAGTAGAAPHQFDLVVQTTAGTLGGAAATGGIAKEDPGYSETIQTTVQIARAAADWGTEPTATTVLKKWRLFPGSTIVVPLNIPIPGGTRLGLRCVGAAAFAYDGTLEIEE